MSVPATKATSPAPRSTITRMSESVSATSHAATRSVYICQVKALRCSGRLKVTRNTGPSRSTSTSSAMDHCFLLLDQCCSGLDVPLSAPAVICGGGVLVRQSGPWAISPILDDLCHPPVRGVQADVGIGGSVQDGDRSGVLRVPHDPARMRAVQPIPHPLPEETGTGD